MSNRKLTIEIPKGNWVLEQSSGHVRVNMNLDELNTDTASWLFNKGLELAIRNAYASVSNPADRQREAERKAREICANVRNAGSRSSWSREANTLIQIYVGSVHNGKMPMGGKAKVWREILELPSDKRDQLEMIAEQLEMIAESAIESSR